MVYTVISLLKKREGRIHDKLIFVALEGLIDNFLKNDHLTFEHFTPRAE
jgi:hypothetical protein